VAGTGLGGVSNGVDYIYDSHYHQIATVQAGNGLSADGHEFLITPQNTALILSYATETADLTSIGGPSNQEVVDGVVQEIDIATGRVLFQWNSADHVPYSQSEQPLPSSPSTPWDWFHVNAVHLDTDGNLLIDARNTWTTYKVNRRSGNIIWQLGGKDSTFKLAAAPGQTLDQAGEIFAWQHDPEALGGDLYTLFDNESAGTPELPQSRVVTVRLDERTHVATLVSSDNQPEGLSAPSQGNAQTTALGNVFVGWGALPYVSEFDRFGHLLFNAEFPAGVNTYRAYLLPWQASRQQ
jgi:Arylsulfotransferase (ASST)